MGIGMEKVQLISVGYAGSTAANFNLLLPYFEGRILFSPVEYRGRGTRGRQGNCAGDAHRARKAEGAVIERHAKNAEGAGNTGYADNTELVWDVADQVKKLRRPKLPYAVLGYSMGAQVVYEMFAQGLLAEKPLCIFIAAHEPPDVPCAGKDVDLCDEAAFLERVKRYGGRDSRLRQDARFAAMFRERMRADFRLLQEYAFSGEYRSFPSRAVVLYCEEDTPFEIVRGWQRFSEKEVRFFLLGSSHFFFRTHAEEFCGIIMKELELTQQERLEGSAEETDQV